MSRFSWLVLSVVVVCLCAVQAQALPMGFKATYEGKGAGAVVFDGSVHATKGLTCADCHEERGLLPALFDTRSYRNSISMRKIEMGQSCGKCHAVTMNDMASCNVCHRK